MFTRGFCPNCEKEADLVFVHKEEGFNVRGELITAPVECYHCQACGEDFETGEQTRDPLEIVYREYRKRKGLLQPEEMKAFRKSLRLTQKEMSEVLGIGVATLNRYENGALQSDAHDQVIRLLMDARNRAKLANDASRSLSAEIRVKILKESIPESEGAGDLLEGAVMLYGSYRADIYSGYRRFDVNRFFQVVKFLCNRAAVVKTKLMKLCFYVDFKHFKENGISITGAHYAHATHGPVPDQFETWLTAMHAWKNEIQMEERMYGEYVGEAYSSSDVDLSVFSLSEIAALNYVRDYFQPFSATKMRKFSHTEEGYTATRDGQLISYEYAQGLQI